MINGAFQYEDCLLKHFVRTDGWLPACKRRLDSIKNSNKNPRRLRYFTFCAVSAIDVLMLDVAKILKPSTSKRFDTVVFFDKNSEHVFETQKRIPGAIGFPGDFINIVMKDDSEEEHIIDGSISLSSPEDAEDTLNTRQHQIDLAQRRQFIDQFPFDVINLDLETFLFKPGDKFPGKVINALRKIFQWQKRKNSISSQNIQVNEFCLLFTTQIGPPNISKDYLDDLKEKLKQNVTDNQNLKKILKGKLGTYDINKIQKEHFDDFFKLGVPKVIMHALMESDWYVDPVYGIRLYEFVRPSKDGNYTMLHFVFDVKRQEPPIEKRSPSQKCNIALDAYKTVTENLFSDSSVIVNHDSIDITKLSKNLESIKRRRQLYCREITL